MARCQSCGWPDIGVELFPAYDQEDALRQANALHDKAWSYFPSFLKCPHEPKVKYVSSENEDF